MQRPFCRCAFHRRSISQTRIDRLPPILPDPFSLNSRPGDVRSASQCTRDGENWKPSSKREGWRGEKLGKKIAVKNNLFTLLAPRTHALPVTYIYCLDGVEKKLCAIVRVWVYARYYIRHRGVCRRYVSNDIPTGPPLSTSFSFFACSCLSFILYQDYINIHVYNMYREVVFVCVCVYDLRP